MQVTVETERVRVRVRGDVMKGSTEVLEQRARGQAEMSSQAMEASRWTEGQLPTPTSIQRARCTPGGVLAPYFYRHFEVEVLPKMVELRNESPLESAGAPADELITSSLC